MDYLQGMKAQKLPDSPIYQLLDGIEFRHNLSHEKVEMLRNQVDYENRVSETLSEIIASPVSKEEKLAEIIKQEEKSPKKEDWPAGMAIDFMLAYRSVEGFEKMAQFIETLPSHLRKVQTFQEQYGFALNRSGQKDKAIQVLTKLIEEPIVTGKQIGRAHV